MIKYDTKTGVGLDEKARQKKKFYEAHLKGMRCGKCGIDTWIRFRQHQGYAGSSSIDMNIEACCPEFKAKIAKRLSIP